MITIVAIGSALAAPPCRDEVVKAARALSPPATSAVRIPALPTGAPEQRLGCGQKCRPSGGWKVVPVKPVAVVATSELDGAPYQADRAIDGDVDTAWSEGVRGPGKGEGLVFIFDEPVLIDLIEVIPGYAKSETLFVGNHRLSEGWVSFHPWPDAGIVPSPVAPKYARRTDVPVACDISTDNVDAVVMVGEPEEPVPLRWDLSSHWCRNPAAGKTRFVVLRIGDVLQGRRYDDTALSEIRFVRLEPLLGSKGWVCR